MHCMRIAFSLPLELLDERYCYTAMSVGVKPALAPLHRGATPLPHAALLYAASILGHGGDAATLVSPSVNLKHRGVIMPV